MNDDELHNIGAERFLISSFMPAYLADGVRRSLGDRAAAARDELACCRACPRNCKINRLTNETKVCRTGRYARISSAHPHFGEENCLRGSRGSGTIFFAMCNLRCVFCQNWDISQVGTGSEMDAEGIAELMLALQERGCHNINLVTPEHVVPQIVTALAVAIEKGLKLPVVYNTSAYDALSSLKLLDGLVDIYMPDFKFWSRQSAARLVKAKDYPERAREAFREMHRQVGDLCFTPDGVACRGLLVRHLVMPGLLEETREIFRFLADDISRDTFVNIMGQYHPAYEVGTAKVSGRGKGEGKHDVCPTLCPTRSATGAAAGSIRYAEINRRPQSAEFEAAYEAARAAGLWRFDQRRY